MISIKYGTTRIVFIVRDYAIKIPNFKIWKLFLLGLLGNMQEVTFTSLRSNKLCPVIFNIPGGFMNIMPKVKELSREEFFNFNYEQFCENDDAYIKNIVENKLDSFGWYKGSIVAIDYGS